MVIKRSTTKKCCCPSDFYLLTPCPDQSSKCPDGGVFVSQCAYDYLVKLFSPFSGYIVIVYSPSCCLTADESTDDTSYTRAEITALGGEVMYCKSEGNMDGSNVEDHETVPQCVSVACQPPNGACCYDYARGRACDDITQEECFEDHAGENPVYHGNGTCCTGSGNECTEGEDEIDCDDPPIDPLCKMKLGRCVYQDVGGEDVYTSCGVIDGVGDGCPSTVSLNFSFPTTPLYQSYPAGKTHCSTCDHEHEACQSLITLPSLSGGGVLERGGGGDNASGLGLWENVDNQEDYNPTVAPTWGIGDDALPVNNDPLSKWTYGGNLSNWVTYSYGNCRPDWCGAAEKPCCPTCEYPKAGKCYDDDNAWSHCFGIHGWNCPFCSAKRLRNWWWSARLATANSSGSLCTCDPPCSCWAMTIEVMIGSTQCTTDSPEGQGIGCWGAVDPDDDTDCHALPTPPCCVPLGGTTVWYSFTSHFAVSWWVGMDGCRCPSDGLSSGNAQTVEGGDGFEQCLGGCGCDDWFSFGGALTIKSSSFINGATWGVS